MGAAEGETGELKSQLYRALDVEYIDQGTFDDHISPSDEITKMATSLMSYLNKPGIKGQKFKNR